MNIQELQEQITGIRNAMSRETEGKHTNKANNLGIWEDRIAAIEDEIKVKEKEEAQHALLPQI